MLILSFICLVLIFLMVFIVGVTSGIDVATIFLLTLVVIPLITVTKILFNI